MESEKKWTEWEDVTAKVQAVSNEEVGHLTMGMDGEVCALACPGYRFVRLNIHGIEAMILQRLA